MIDGKPVIVEGEVDKECCALCDAINDLPGVETIGSCCGHGRTPYAIWFRTTDLKYLPRLIYYFNFCHCGYANWKVIVRTDCAMSPVTFKIEGPTGEDAYKQAEDIAVRLRREATQERTYEESYPAV